MRRALAVLAAVVPSLAWPCGGFFAQNIEVAADQKIVVIHREGVETYVFRPHFCGTATDFGVILPIPSTLASSPTLADNALFDDLDAFTTPQVVEQCIATAVGCGGANPGGVDYASDAGTHQDVNVVDRGRVGIFDYALLQATSPAAFTDWLDQNGFPYDAASSAVYASYVEKRWYFVAFKVTADTTAVPQGMKLCGDLGPIELSFAAANPVVPARIASVNGGSGTWRLFTIATGQQTLDVSSTGFRSTLYFSGRLSGGGSGALATASRDGERLTVLDVSPMYGSASTDIGLESTPAQDFRTTHTVYRECLGTCSTSPELTLGVLGAVAFLFRPRRRHREGRG